MLTECKTLQLTTTGSPRFETDPRLMLPSSWTTAAASTVSPGVVVTATKIATQIHVEYCLNEFPIPERHRNRLLRRDAGGGSWSNTCREFIAMLEADPEGATG